MYVNGVRGCLYAMSNAECTLSGAKQNKTKQQQQQGVDPEEERESEDLNQPA